MNLISFQDQLHGLALTASVLAVVLSQLFLVLSIIADYLDFNRQLSSLLVLFSFLFILGIIYWHVHLWTDTLQRKTLLLALKNL